MGVLKYSFHILWFRTCWVKAALTGTTQKEGAGFVHENVTATIGDQNKGSSGLSGGARVRTEEETFQQFVAWGLAEQEVVSLSWAACVGAVVHKSAHSH